MGWLVYHVVNNDIALHVLFDDLSTEYESRWYKHLPPEEKIQIAGIPGIPSDPYFFTRDDAKNGISEFKKFIREFEDVQIPSTLSKYKISTPAMKRRILESANAAGL